MSMFKFKVPTYLPYNKNSERLKNIVKLRNRFFQQKKSKKKDDNK